MTRIKICGLSSVEDAVKTAEIGADLLGFVFAQSRRQVSSEHAAEMINTVKKLNCPPDVVGVFVNSEPLLVNLVAEQCRLDWVQLSGDETWEYCKEIRWPIIKVIHVLPEMTHKEVIRSMEEGYGLGLRQKVVCLLDAKVKAAYGGTGQIFDWATAAEVSARFSVFIAGGLSELNVAELISRVRPLGVDVSSGVETEGRKDIVKIRHFMEAVRRADSSVGGVKVDDKPFCLEGNTIVT